MMLKKILHFPRSLLFKLLTSYFLLIIIPVVLIGLFSFKASEKIIYTQISRYKNDMLIQVENNIDSLITQIVAVVNIYNLDTEIEPMLENKNLDRVDILKNSQIIENKMLGTSSVFYWLEQEYVFIGFNGTIYTTNNNAYSSIDLESIPKQPWYGRLMENTNRILWLSTHKSFISNNYVFTASKVLKNYYTAAEYGFLFLSIDENSLYSIYDDSLDGQNQIFIIDSQGNVISHSIREYVGKNINSDNFVDFSSDKHDNHKIVTMNNIDYFSTSKKIEKLDWYVIEMVPVSSISKDINSLALKILVVSLVCILFCVFTAILFSKKISTPLINLSNKVLSYRHSANIQDNDIQNKDEISLLTEEYDKIVDRLETTIHDLMKEQEEKRKAELQALQMQINPHFLYNTLNSIQCLVWTNKTKFIGPTIKALVNLLQQTIGGKNEFITLEEELNILDNYVYLHKIRTCDTICFTYELEESLKKYKTPRLLLQPIVENSIFHGLEPKGSKGAISVKCTSDKHDIVIEIKDNGIGMKQSRVTEILSGKIDSPEDSFSGIGIKNVDERIKSYFGKQYGLSIVSAPGEGTTVTVRFKKIRNKKVEYDV